MSAIPGLALRKPTVLTKPEQAIRLLRSLYRETSCLFDEVARKHLKIRIRDRFRECKEVEDEQRITKLLKDGRRILSTLVRANRGDKWRQVYVLQHAYGKVGKRKHELLKPFTNLPKEDPFIPGLPRSAPPPKALHLTALLKAQVNKNIKMIEPPIPESNAAGKPFPIIRKANMLWRHRSQVMEKIVPPMDPQEFERMELIVMGYQNSTPPKRRFIIRDTVKGRLETKPHNWSPRKQRRLLKYILEQFPVMGFISNADGSQRVVANYSPVLTSTLHTEGLPEDFAGVDEKGGIVGLRPQTALIGQAAEDRKRVNKRIKAFADWQERMQAEGKIPKHTTSNDVK